MTDIPELTEEQLKRAIPLRTFVGLTQTDFAKAMGISVHTLRNWEQGRRQPEGPAIALLRIAARHPRILRENLEAAAQGGGLGARCRRP
jgi:putative transcriptional regulator